MLHFPAHYPRFISFSMCLLCYQTSDSRHNNSRLHESLSLCQQWCIYNESNKGHRRVPCSTKQVLNYFSLWHTLTDTHRIIQRRVLPQLPIVCHSLNFGNSWGWVSNIFTNFNINVSTCRPSSKTSSQSFITSWVLQPFLFFLFPFVIAFCYLTNFCVPQGYSPCLNILCGQINCSAKKTY